MVRQVFGVLGGVECSLGLSQRLSIDTQNGLLLNKGTPERSQLMPVLQYKFQRKTFFERPDPQPHLDQIRELNGFVRVGDLPLHVPAGCNPRKQNIDKGIYRQVVDSLVIDKEDRIFHLKNRGITVLAQSIKNITHNDDHVLIDVEVPDSLGNVDGNHTQNIIDKFGSQNPTQFVSVVIKAAIPEKFVSDLAQALNTNMPVTASSMADHRGLFDPIRATLETYPYSEWIGYRQNAPNVTATSKDLISLMWVCHPSVPETKAWLPNWIYTQSGRVYDNFYNPTVDKDEFRAFLMRMNPVLPDIIELFCYVNEGVTNYITKKQRAQRGGGSEKAVKTLEVSVSDLCVKSLGYPFRDPADRTKRLMLRECYRFMVISGLRALLMEGPNGIQWREPLPVVKMLLSKALPKIYQAIVVQLRQTRRNHNETSRCPALWIAPQSEIDKVYSQWRESRLREEIETLSTRKKSA